MTKTRAQFMAEMGLEEADLEPPMHINKIPSTGNAVDDSMIRSVPLYDTSLLESLKAEQCVSKATSKPVAGCDISGNEYLRQELSRFRSSRGHEGYQADGQLIPAEEEPETLPPLITEAPDYAKLGYDGHAAQNYKQELLDTFRKRKEQGLVVTAEQENQVAEAEAEEEAKSKPTKEEEEGQHPIPSTEESVPATEQQVEQSGNEEPSESTEKPQPETEQQQQENPPTQTSEAATPAEQQPAE